MALNAAKLKQAFKAALKTAGEAAQKDPPDSPDKILDDLAQGLADAVRVYITGGQVVGIATTVDVSGITDVNGQPVSGSGVGTQTGTGRII